MIGATPCTTTSTNYSSPDRTAVLSSLQKQRFPLSLCKKTKQELEARLVEEKLQQDAKLTEPKNSVERREKELQDINTKVHLLEETIRKRRQRVAGLGDAENEPPKKVVRRAVASKMSKSPSDKLELSSAQFLRRRKKTLAALRPIYCSGETVNSNQKPIIDGLWSTLVSTTTTKELKDYISTSKVCQTKVLPLIVRDKVQEYEKSQSNKIRSIRTLYEGGLLSKREYTAKRNSGDNIQDDPDSAGCNQFMPDCKIPKLLPNKKLMSLINGIDIGEVNDLESLAEKMGSPICNRLI